MTSSASTSSQITAASASAVPQLVSRPDSVRFHEIEDYELERLMRIERPIALASASGCLGAAIGLLPIICDAVAILGAGTPMPIREGLLSIVFALCLGVGVVNAKDAYLGKMDADAFLAKIRGRPLTSR